MEDPELALLVDHFMRHIHFGLQAKAHEFDKAGVGPQGGIILLTLAELGCPPLNELTKKVARDKSQMTRVIRSLETKGLVRRKPSPSDARVTLVELSDEGQEVVHALAKAVASTIDDILAPVSQAEKDQLKAILKRAFR